MRHKKTILAWVFMLAGALALSVGLYFSPERAWLNLLLNAVYYVTLSLSAVFFLALHYVSGAKWSEVLRKIPEAVSVYLPVGGFMILLVTFGAHFLFHWSHHDVIAQDPILLGKSGYLNIPFYIARLVVIIGLWSFFAWKLRQNSRKQDATLDIFYFKKNIFVSVIFLFFMGYSLTLASTDWIMSLEPHWYSTIFGIYNFSGLFVNGLAVITLIAIYLKQKNLLPEINENHFHDLGKYLFAFTTFWAYIWFCQFVLIWYANIPEETVYYYKRLNNNWDWLFYLNFAMNFVVPFFMLLPRSTKRNTAILARVCILLLVGRWLDLYLLMSPGVLHDNPSIGVLEVVVSLGFAALFIQVVGGYLMKHKLLPCSSVVLEESLHHHQ